MRQFIWNGFVHFDCELKPFCKQANLLSRWGHSHIFCTLFLQIHIPHPYNVWARHHHFVVFDGTAFLAVRPVKVVTCVAASPILLNLKIRLGVSTASEKDQPTKIVCRHRTENLNLCKAKNADATWTLGIRTSLQTMQNIQYNIQTCATWWEDKLVNRR